ncbi:MAG: DUF1684 domain-containing protein [Trueperaceae bacterium]
MTTDAPHRDAPPDPAIDPAAAADLAAWRAAYAAHLAGPDGWWAVAGLDWLGEGAHRLGSAAGCAVRTPPGTADHVATLTLDGDDVVVEPTGPEHLWADGAPVVGAVRVAGADRPFALGPEDDAVRSVVLRRAGRHGVRTYDPRQAAARAAVAGVGWFAATPGWRVPARFEPAAPDERVAIVNVLGDALELPAAGRLRFEHAGETHALLATWSGERLFVNFRDATNGTSTYGAGRFLTVDPPTGNRAWLDFHRAHHPPCAHTPYATCPLPPLENRLAFAVTAGERHP